MRITQAQREAILEAVHAHFGQGTRVVLFGSRVDDDARGGDIDILIETDRFEPTSRAAISAKLHATAQIQRKIGDRKIDIVVANTGSDLGVVRQARAHGIPL